MAARRRKNGGRDRFRECTRDGRTSAGARANEIATTRGFERIPWLFTTMKALIILPGGSPVQLRRPSLPGFVWAIVRRIRPSRVVVRGERAREEAP
eukprot:31476-Pelagococcus_subviridis.AAC.19